MIGTFFTEKTMRLAFLALLLAVCASAPHKATLPAFAAEAASEELKDGCEKGGAGYKGLEQNLTTGQARKNAAFLNAHNNATNAAREARGSMENPLGSFEKYTCLDMLSQYQNWISSLLGLAGTILNTLIGFVNQLLAAVCNYVVAAINNVLNSICIPMPDLPSLPGFDSPDRKSCNGYSLADLVSVNARSYSVPYVSSTSIDRTLGLGVSKLNQGVSRGTRQ